MNKDKLALFQQSRSIGYDDYCLPFAKPVPQREEMRFIWS
jgi:hypothetical protein